MSCATREASDRKRFGRHREEISHPGREKAGASRARDGRGANVLFNAEETPGQSLTKLRIRMIEAYSPYEVAGAVYFLRRKPRKRTEPAER